MAKKLKKIAKNPSSPRRSSEKMRRHVRQFNRAVLLYIVVVAAAVFAASAGKFDLGNSTSGGFAYNFLLLPASLPLIIVGGISSLTGNSFAIAHGYEAYYFGMIDIFLIVNVWWIIRLTAFKRQSAAFLRTTRVFVLIMVCWGVFQLTCGALHWAWKNSARNIHKAPVIHSATADQP